jgi:hypothetical protein
MINDLMGMQDTLNVLANAWLDAPRVSEATLDRLLAYYQKSNDRTRQAELQHITRSLRRIQRDLNLSNAGTLRNHAGPVLGAVMARLNRDVDPNKAPTTEQRMNLAILNAILGEASRRNTRGALNRTDEIDIDEVRATRRQYLNRFTTENPVGNLPLAR